MVLRHLKNTPESVCHHFQKGRLTAVNERDGGQLNPFTK